MLTPDLNLRIKMLSEQRLGVKAVVAVFPNKHKQCNMNNLNVVVAAWYAETCRLLFFGSRHKRNRQALTAVISYRGCQNGTKIGRLIEGALLNITI